VAIRALTIAAFARCTFACLLLLLLLLRLLPCLERACADVVAICALTIAAFARCTFACLLLLLFLLLPQRASCCVVAWLLAKPTKVLPRLWLWLVAIKPTTKAAATTEATTTTSTATATSTATRPSVVAWLPTDATHHIALVSDNQTPLEAKVKELEGG
jgi:hypothetical protein